MHGPWVKVHLVIGNQGVQNRGQQAQWHQVHGYLGSKVRPGGVKSRAALSKEVAFLEGEGGHTNQTKPKELLQDNGC